VPAATAIFFILSNVVIAQGAGGRLHGSIGEVPHNDVGMVLGTAPTLWSGAPNPYFWDRIDAAARLHESGKVDHLLLSGDREIAAMREALLERGVPAQAMTIDDAGYRTLDSVVRARTVYGLDSYTIVTQCYHAKRAVTVAKAQGMDAVAFCTPHPAGVHRLEAEVREIFARALAFLDLYVLRRGVQSPGPPKSIEL
jgi:SanA protein